MLFFFLFFFFQTISSIPLLDDLSHSTYLAPHLTLYWRFSSDNEFIDLALQYNRKGHFSIGFGDDMKKVDMITIEKENENLILTDRWSIRDEIPLEDKQFGGKNDLELTYFNVKNEEKTICFRRKLDTGDKFDHIIKKEKTIITYAFSDNDFLSYHEKNYFSFFVDFSKEGKQKAVYINKFKNTLIDGHAIGLLLGWGFVVEIPIFYARIRRNVEKHMWWALGLAVWSVISGIILTGLST